VVADLFGRHVRHAVNIATLRARRVTVDALPVSSERPYGHIANAPADFTDAQAFNDRFGRRTLSSTGR
jgi:hypothetical protein